MHKLAVTFLSGAITTRRRTDDWMAFVTGDERLWDCSPHSAEEAVGKLLLTHPAEIAAAISGVAT